MPVVDVEIVGKENTDGLAGKIANCVGRVLGMPKGRTWVKLRFLPEARYAEHGGTPADVRPVFVSLLLADVPDVQERQRQVADLARELGKVCGRPADNVHVLYEAPAKGRMAFGGRLVT